VKLTDLASIFGGFWGTVSEIIALIVAVYGFYRWSFNRGKASVTDNQERTRRANVAKKLYSPLRVALSGVHFETCTLTLYPRFVDRFRNACDKFLELKYFKAKVKHFFAALGDKGKSESFELTTGFPIEEIESIVKDNSGLADKSLIDLVHRIRIMQSSPWDYDESDIVKEQYFLSQHIYRFHDELKPD